MALPLPRRITTLQGQPVTANADGSVTFVADADIDCDGSGGNPEHDPWFQPDTTLHHLGKALNAYVVPFIVLPPVVIKGVAPVMLGSFAEVKDLRTGKTCLCVVADVGPSKKLGELSVAAARRLGIPSSPVHGGVDEMVIEYKIWPGVAAVIDGVTYKLQPYR